MTADPRQLAEQRRAARRRSYAHTRRQLRCTWHDAGGRCSARAAARSPLCLLHGADTPSTAVEASTPSGAR
jgi:hypothetical protein